MIRAVTFDVWETMIHDEPVLSAGRSRLRVERMAKVLRRQGFDIDDNLLERSYEDSWQRLEEIWDTGREVDTREQLAIILEPLGDLAARLDVVTWADLDDAYVAPVYDKPPLLAAELLHVLDTLHTSGLRLGLVCNTGRTPGFAMRRLLGDHYGVLDYFSALAFSNEEDIRKPDPAIFLGVLGKLGVPPDQAVHIGDNLIADIAGAKSAGMRAVLFRRDVPNRVPVSPDVHITNLVDFRDALRKLGAR